MRRFFRWFITSAWRPSPGESDKYCAERDWVEQFTAEGDWSDPRPQLALAHAQLKHREAVERRAQLDAKCTDMAKTAGALIVVIFTAVQATETPLTWPLRASLVSLLLALLIAVWLRRVLMNDAPATTRAVMECLPRVREPEAWIAASFHAVDEGMRVAERWTAWRLGIASWLVCAGIGLLVLAAFTLTV